MEKLLEHLGFASPFVYAAAAYGLFVWLDNEASNEAKAALAGTMKLKDYDHKQIASAVVEVFDRLYTVPLLHWRAMLRSSLVTIAVSAVFAFEMRNTKIIADLQKAGIAWEFYAHTLGTNLISDYISLFLIRPRLSKSGNRPVRALVLGALLGIFVIYLGMTIRLLLEIHVITFTSPCAPVPIVSGIEPDLSCWTSRDNFVLLSTVPASAVFVWLPLFALGILVARALAPLSRVVGRFQWALKEGDQHPLKAIGCVAGLAVFIVAAACQTLFKT
jgi:hypothetical protein